MISTENGNNGMVMPVAPMYGGGYGRGNNLGGGGVMRWTTPKQSMKENRFVTRSNI